jgi:DNA-binding Lrp family transcriptional regulator
MTSRVSESVAAGPGEWTFLTNHAHVLLCLAADPEVRLRDVADSVGITERAVQHIVMELEDAGYLERERVGRRNRYHLHGDQPLRHPMDRDHRVNELLTVLSRPPAPKRSPVKKGVVKKAGVTKPGRRAPR